jgi:hypothetical protein
MNCLAAVVNRLKQDGAELTCDEIHGVKDRQQRPLAILAAEYGRVKELFDVDLWRGPLADAQTAWEKIPPAIRKMSGMSEEDFAGLVASHNQRALKERAGKVKLKF